MPPKDFPSHTPELVRVQAINPNYRIPKLNRVPRAQLLEKLGLEYTEFHASPFYYFESLRDHPTITQSEYASLATETLRENGFEQDAVNYFFQITIPALTAMHQDHALRGEKGAIERFVANLDPRITTKTLAVIKEETAKAITFTERREETIEAMNTVLADWVRDRNEGRIASPVEAIVAHGSYIRGDAMYLSDLDIVAFADRPVTTDEFYAFKHGLQDKIREVNPYLPEVEIWFGEIFPFRNARALLREAHFSTTGPTDKYKIFAPPDRQKHLTRSLANLKP